MNQQTAPPRLSLLRLTGDLSAATGIIALIIGLRYLLNFDFPTGPLGIVYTLVAMIGHFFQLGWLVWLITLPIVLLLPLRKLIRPLFVLVASFSLAVLLLDSMVFAEHRFHFTPLTVKILGSTTWMFGIIYFVIGFILLWKLSGMFSKRAVARRKTLPRLTLAVITLVCLLLTHIIHAWADANYYTPVTRLTSHLPVFYPATAKRFFQTHGFVDLEKARERKLLDEAVAGSGKGNLTYPLRPLTFVEPERKQNILVILIDEFRHDLLTPERAPRLAAWAARNQCFTNHLSGGNSTRMGCFSLFYGLPSTYWQSFESERRPPILITRLQELGYEFGIFSSAPLYAPASLDRTAFSTLPGLTLEWKLAKPYARDSLISDHWKRFLDTVDSPFFGFLFYDALCMQSVPDGFGTRVSSDTKDADKKEFSAFLNSMVFLDSLIGDVLDDLARRGLDSSTVVILTADHGEEFNESGDGIRGHGSGYGNHQLQVPLAIAWPGREPAVITKRTSHYDVVPTVLNHALGCVDSSNIYSSGGDLFSPTEWSWLIAGSYFNYAIIEPEQMTVAYPNGFFEIRDRDYKLISHPTINASVLKEAYAEIGRFYRK